MRNVSASDFHDIVVRRDAGKAERLFRASVSAFCSLTRPSRREALQLDDLTLPLFDMVSVDARRYVAAALSECSVVPPELHARLVDQPVEVSAPLLVRSTHLRDVDLIGVIGRHGLGHARAIARRKNLNPAIANLIRALESAASIAAETKSGPSPSAELPEPAAEAEGTLPLPGAAAEGLRKDLRNIMLKSRPVPEKPAAERQPDVDYVQIRDAALTGESAFVTTALAEALHLNLATARTLPSAGGLSSLLAAFRALDFSEERAFLLAATMLPGQFPHTESIRLFLERYRALGPETARERVRGWRQEMVANWIQWQSANARHAPKSPVRSAARAVGRPTLP